MTLGRFFRLIIGISLFPATVAFVVEAADYLVEYGEYWFRSPFGMGALVSVIVAMVALILGIAWWLFAGTFEHELGHLLFVLFFWWRPNRFLVTPGEGEVVPGPQGCVPAIFVDIAIVGAYTIPVFTIPFLLIKLFASGLSTRLDTVLDFIIGFTFVFYLVRVFIQSLPWYHGDPGADLRRIGFVFGYAVIFLVNSIWSIGILALILDDREILTDYLYDAAFRAQEIYEAIFAFLGGLF